MRLRGVSNLSFGLNVVGETYQYVSFDTGITTSIKYNCEPFPHTTTCQPLYYKFSTECAREKHLKIGQYLAKKWTKACGLAHATRYDQFGDDL